MIIIPLYMNNFNISTQIVSPEEREARLAVRNRVITLLQEHIMTVDFDEEVLHENESRA